MPPKADSDEDSDFNERFHFVYQLSHMRRDELFKLSTDQLRRMATILEEGKAET